MVNVLLFLGRFYFFSTTTFVIFLANLWSWVPLLVLLFTEWWEQQRRRRPVMFSLLRSFTSVKDIGPGFSLQPVKMREGWDNTHTHLFTFLNVYPVRESSLWLWLSFRNGCDTWGERSITIMTIKTPRSPGNVTSHLWHVQVINVIIKSSFTFWHIKSAKLVFPFLNFICLLFFSLTFFILALFLVTFF